MLQRYNTPSTVLRLAGVHPNAALGERTGGAGLVAGGRVVVVVVVAVSAISGTGVPGHLVWYSETGTVLAPICACCTMYKQSTAASVVVVGATYAVVVVVRFAGETVSALVPPLDSHPANTKTATAHAANALRLW